MKCGWRARTTDINQRESLRVTSPPVPAAFPVNRSISSKNVLSLRVTVKESHFDSLMLRVKTSGRPKSSDFLASSSQRVQDPPGSSAFRVAGGV